LFVRVRVTPDVDEERRVIDDSASFLVEPDSFREPERDQALTEHVLHRLPEPQIDAERQRRHELREANARRGEGGHGVSHTET
jgi:hypothetical protein